MLKVYIDNEEVVVNQNFTIQKHMLNTSSVILNNVCPKSWCENKDYTTNFYHPLDYSKCKIQDEIYHPEVPGETITTNNTAYITGVDTTKQVELTNIEGNTTQSGTPTPTTPQAVNVVSGEQDILVCGKNLYNKDIFMQGTWQSSSPSNRIVGFLIPTKTGQKYRVSLRNNELDFAIGNTTKNIQSGNTQVQSDSGWQTTDYTYTITGDGYLFLQVKKRYGGNLTPSDLSATDFQVELGETSTTYEVYNGTTYGINLGKNLWNEDYTNISTGVKYKPLYVGDGTFTMSSNIPQSASGNSLFFLTGNVSSGASSSTNGVDTTISRTITSTNGYITVGYRGGGNYIDPREYKTQIEKGSVATTYTPYKTPIELCKINDYKDRIYKLDHDSKNLYNDTLELGTISSSGVNNSSTTNSRTVGYTSVEANKTYTISSSINCNIAIRYYDSNKTFLSSGTTAQTPNTFTTPENTAYVRFVFTYMTDLSDLIKLELGNQATTYEPYGTKGTWFIEKNIGKVVLDGSESWVIEANYNRYKTSLSNSSSSTTRQKIMSNYFKYSGTNEVGVGFIYVNKLYLYPESSITTETSFKNWLSTHNTIVYYVYATPIYTQITDSELINQLNAIELLNGLNNISITSNDLTGTYTIHYNFKEAYTDIDLLFCGVVKNSGNISLNPREPHYSSLQILDFKTFLSEGETLDYVIYQKTILEAIQQVIGTISEYGFVLGNVNILNPNDIIGAYSTKDKTAYDVFNYIADITQSRWTTRLVDENTVAIDFYDPTLMPQGTAIDYNQIFFENNLIDDMKYSYGTNNYRNKQVMTSSQVYANISQTQTIVANGYQTQFPVEQPIGKINSISVNGIPLTFSTYNEKEMGYVADFYYNPGDNYFDSNDLRSTGDIILIEYIPIIEGRQVITNSTEINRINDSTGRKGIVARYENRNDATTSTELQKIGESYIKYKGTPEIKLTIQSRKNIWEVGQRVQFNAPVEELDTEYMVRTKKINYIYNQQDNNNTLFYTYELISSFNSETEINYFDNQRSKANGNIGEGEYISRNIDIESTANIIFYDTGINEITVDGDNTLNAILDSPFIS